MAMLLLLLLLLFAAPPPTTAAPTSDRRPLPQGFSAGLFNSLVAVPLVSRGMVEPMARLTGSEDDPPDNVLKELLIMQAGP